MSEPPPPPMLRRVVVSLVVIAAALGGGHVLLRRLAALKKDPERAPGGPTLPVVRVVTIGRGDHREVLRGYGIARGLREARVSAEVAGIVRAVSPLLEVGTSVRPPPEITDGHATSGPEPLVRVDRQDLDDALARLKAERLQAVAERKRAEADVANLETQLEVSARRLETARGELRRILTLVPDTLPESEADRQRLAVFALEQLDGELLARRDQARASLAVIDARLAVVDVQSQKALRDIERTNVYAPFPGKITARYVELGALVAPGAPLFDLVDPTTVEVAIALPASRYGQVVSGEADAEGVSHVELRLHEDEDVVWRGPVRRIDPKVDVQARTFRVYVEVEGDEATERIAPGTHVVADVEGALYRDVLVVPREAFVEDRVYVVRAAQAESEDVWVAHERVPRVRAVLAGVTLAEPEGVEDGLQADDQVVITNLEDVADGSRLRILSTENEDRPERPR